MGTMSQTRRYKERKKIFKEGLPALIWIERAFAVMAFGLIQWAQHLYDAHPYPWYRIGEFPTLLLGFALMLALVRFSLKGAFLIANNFISHRSKISQVIEIAFLLLIPLSIIWGVFSHPQLYTIPFIIMMFFYLGSLDKGKK